MKYIGGLILINVLIISAYFVLATQVSSKRIAVFAGIGLFLGIAVMLCDRITGVKVSGIGEITTAVQKATADAEEVEKIRKEVEEHKDTIALIMRDANKARKDLDEVAFLSLEAKDKADQIAHVLTDAQTALDDIKTVSDFGLVLTRASNDDRPSFDSLLQIANDKDHRFFSIANQALIKIITDPQVTGLLTYNIDWKKEHNIDPSTVSFEEFVEVFKRELSIRQPSVLSAMWNQERFPRSQKLQALYEVIRTTPSLRCLHHACKLMNEEAKLGKNILAYDLFLKWWEENRALYQEKDGVHEKNAPESQ
jgi:hypothetical protein